MEKADKIALSKAYIKARGFEPARVSTLEPLLPAIVLDCALQIWRKDVTPHGWKQQAKHYEKLWRKKYHNFNRKFFMAFNDDEQDAVINLMDEFEEYIGNDVMICKLQFLRMFSHLDTDQAVICSAIFMCNILSQAAECIYGGVFKNALGEDWREPDIRGMREASYRLANLYHRGITDVNVNPNEFAPLRDAVDILCKKMYRWLAQDNNKE